MSMISINFGSITTVLDSKPISDSLLLAFVLSKKGVIDFDFSIDDISVAYKAVTGLELIDVYDSYINFNN